MYEQYEKGYTCAKITYISIISLSKTVIHLTKQIVLEVWMYKIINHEVNPME